MECILERHSIIDPESTSGTTGEASIILVESYEYNLLLSYRVFHLSIIYQNIIIVT
jgi:hypothetical protein